MCTYANHTIQIQMLVGLKYSGDSVVQVRTHLLTSDFGSSTRGERQFLKFFRNHTMLTIPQNSAQLMVQSKFLNIVVGPQLLNIIVGPNFSSSWSDPNFNCLPLRLTTQLLDSMAEKSILSAPINSQLTLFQKLQSMVQSKFLNIVVGPQLLNIIVGPNFSPSWSDPNFNCLPLRLTTQLLDSMAEKSILSAPINSQLTLFQKLQFLRTIAYGQDIIHTTVPFLIRDLLWQLW